MPYSTYRKALRLAQKDRKTTESGTLAVLEEKALDIAYREPLGTIDIPMDLIAGTLTEARAISFSPNFLPLMEENTEFAVKWIALSDAHLTEGIRDPIKAVEYLGRYYVVEGNKRVSVLRYYGAASVPGTVTRYVPQRTPGTEAYYEYLDFYRATGINYLLFDRKGGYADLLKAMSREPGAPWNADDLSAFRNLYFMFREAYLRQGGTPDETAEALLVYLDVFDYQQALRKLPRELDSDLARLRPELLNRQERAGVALLTDDAARVPLLHFTGEVSAAFVHDRTAHDSAWVYAHELGRRDLEGAMELPTFSYEGIDGPEEAAKAFEDAVNRGANVIFITSPQLWQAGVKAAVAYPQVKFLNCALGMSYPSMRAYYARTYEAQYLLGAVAGALTVNDKINYIADAPIYGTTADINAFALGAQVVNPRAVVSLEWSQAEGTGSRSRLSDAGATYISEVDRLSPHDAQGRGAGLYLAGESHNMAISLCRWGEIYIKIVRRIMDGSWKNDARGASAVNYWWGLKSGAVDIVLSRRVPQGTRQLVGLLREALSSRRMRPFSGEILTQSGEKMRFDGAATPQDLATVGWLAANVEGGIPSPEELTENGRELVGVQGLGRGI